MNWGKGIIVAMLLFMSFIAMLIAMMVRNGDGLEEAAYYEKGNLYNEKLERLRNAARPGRDVRMYWETSRNMLCVVFQEGNLPDSGRLLLLRPSNLKKDFSLKLLSGRDTQYVSWEGRQRGQWKLQCDWHSAGRDYMHEQELFVP